MKTPPRKAAAKQRGNFVPGFIAGLLFGIALALCVALYIAKVPVPFVNKVPQRTAEQDAAEIERNKNWDPNGPLSSRQARPPTASVPASTPVNTMPPPAPPAPPVVTRPDPAAILAGRTPPETGLSTKSPTDAFIYFVQAGAYSRAEDAEAQRAKLAMSGWLAKVTEREQSGRTVYRVRLGPYDKKDDASQMKASLEGVGVESALVQVQK